MSEEEIKDIWMNAGEDEVIELDLKQLVVSLKVKVKKMDRTLFFRDFREIIAAIFIMIFFGYKSITDSGMVTKVTSVLFVVWAGYVAYRLLDVRKYKKAIDLGASFKKQLLQERYYLEQQAHLLDNILSWYVGPFAMIMIISIVGGAFDNQVPLLVIGLHAGVMLVVTYFFSRWLYKMNKNAAKTAYSSLIENIDKILVQLDEDHV